MVSVNSAMSVRECVAYERLPPPATNHMKGKPMMSKEAIRTKQNPTGIEVDAVDGEVRIRLGFGHWLVLDPTNANLLARAIRQKALEAEEGKVKAE